MLYVLYPVFFCEAVYERDGAAAQWRGTLHTAICNRLAAADFSTALSAANASCLTFGLAALYVIPLILLIVSEVRRHEKR